jgi:hypothetical protein
MREAWETRREAVFPHMSRCQAFRPIAGTREAWIPCIRCAEAGSAFCRAHGDAIFGAMLGRLALGLVVKDLRPVGKKRGSSLSGLRSE